MLNLRSSKPNESALSIAIQKLRLVLLEKDSEAWTNYWMLIKRKIHCCIADEDFVKQIISIIGKENLELHNQIIKGIIISAIEHKNQSSRESKKVKRIDKQISDKESVKRQQPTKKDETNEQSEKKCDILTFLLSCSSVSIRNQKEQKDLSYLNNRLSQVCMNPKYDSKSQSSKTQVLSNSIIFSAGHNAFNRLTLCPSVTWNSNKMTLYYDTNLDKLINSRIDEISSYYKITVSAGARKLICEGQHILFNNIFTLINKYTSFTITHNIQNNKDSSIIIDSCALLKILEYAKQLLGPLRETELQKLRMYSINMPSMSLPDRDRRGF